MPGKKPEFIFHRLAIPARSSASNHKLGLRSSTSEAVADKKESTVTRKYPQPGRKGKDMDGREGTLGKGTLWKGTLWKPIHPPEKISATIEDGSDESCGVMFSLLFQS
jgi:hypothetical protein